MWHSFAHHVARCCMMLEDVERSLIFIKHRLQQTSNISFVFGGERQSCIRLATVFNIVDRAYPLCWHCGYLYPWRWFIVCICFARCYVGVQATIWRTNKRKLKDKRSLFESERDRAKSQRNCCPNSTTFSDWMRTCHVLWVNSLRRTNSLTP